MITGTEMTISDYAAIKELENEHRDGWGSTTALWVIVAAIIVFAIVYNWTKNCNEKVQFAVGMSRMEGRLNCIEPNVDFIGKQLYAANGAISATVQGVGDMKSNFDNQLFQLNREVFFETNHCCGRDGRGRGGNCCGGGNREFAQTQNYTLASQGVTVTERCIN